MSEFALISLFGGFFVTTFILSIVMVLGDVAVRRSVAKSKGSKTFPID
ncbi:hypothetical protein GW916_07775 [bacterium]|nr:hypothetical protein [bacterium]